MSCICNPTSTKVWLPFDNLELLYHNTTSAIFIESPDISFPDELFYYTKALSDFILDPEWQAPISQPLLTSWDSWPDEDEDRHRYIR